MTRASVCQRGKKRHENQLREPRGVSSNCRKAIARRGYSTLLEFENTPWTQGFVDWPLKRQGLPPRERRQPVVILTAIPV
jgi:hypothetical protein